MPKRPFWVPYDPLIHGIRPMISGRSVIGVSKSNLAARRVRVDRFRHCRRAFRNQEQIIRGNGGGLQKAAWRESTFQLFNPQLNMLLLITAFLPLLYLTTSAASASSKVIQLSDGKKIEVSTAHTFSVTGS
jgi:hypothetical protein